MSGGSGLRRAVVAAVLTAGAPAVARAATAEAPSGFVDTLGRFHPALVHFSVALILAAAVAEALCVARRNGRFADAARFMITAAAWISVVTTATGFARAGSITIPPDEASAFAVHRVAGVVVPVLAFLAAGLAEGTRRSGQIWELFLYRIVLVLAAVAVTVAGYNGGELVYGVGFFPLW
jgi:uncharacterized membrane protein